MSCIPDFTWNHFKQELLNRFGGIANCHPYEQLAALHQKDNMDEYVNEFELIASMIPRELEALYLGYFMNGLKEEIKIWVRLLEPVSRLSAINIAQNGKVALGHKRGIGCSNRYEGDKREIGHTQDNPNLNKSVWAISPLS